jgi:hypothetical protein
MTPGATTSSSLHNMSEARASTRSRSALVFAGVTLTLGAALIASSACVEAEAKFYIVSPGSGAMGGCSAGMGGCDFLVGAANVQGDQIGCYVVDSGLIQRANSQTNHVESSRILLNEVDVEVFSASGARVDNFTRSISGFIEPPSNGGRTDQGVTLPVLRTESAAALPAGQQGTVGIIIKGRTTGGLNLQTPEYFTPIYVLDPMSQNNPCKSSGSSMSSSGAGACCLL